MSGQHTTGPWEVVEATAHHGFYVVTHYGSTVCDLYAMSNPNAASVRNGGDSYPVPFNAPDDGANARLIAAAPDLLEALQYIAKQWPDSFAARTARAALAKARGAA